MPGVGDEHAVGVGTESDADLAQALSQARLGIDAVAPEQRRQPRAIGAAAGRQGKIADQGARFGAARRDIPAVSRRQPKAAQQLQAAAGSPAGHGSAAPPFDQSLGFGLMNAQCGIGKEILSASLFPTATGPACGRRCHSRRARARPA